MEEYVRKTIILITHDDLDGAGCHVVFEQMMYYSYHFHEIYHSHNNTVDDDTKMIVSEHDPNATNIIFADICPSKEVLLQLKKKKFDCVVLDHHPTNEYAKEVFPLSVIKSGPDCSGTSLLYEYLTEYVIGPTYNGKLNKVTEAYIEMLMTYFVEKITRWDTFEWKKHNDLDAKKLNDLLYIMKMNTFCKYMRSQINLAQARIISGEKFDPFNMIGFFIGDIFLDMLEEKQKSEEEFIDGIIKNPKVIEFKLPETDYSAALMLAPNGVNISELATKYLAAYPKVDILIYYMQQYNTLSFRTARDDIDCGAICRKYGGGGHPKAAGCSMPDGFEYIILNNVEDYLEGRL